MHADAAVKKLLLAAALCATIAADAGAVTGTGGAPGAFLRSGVGARALALSGAFTAATDDLTCSYWNPAATAYLNRAGASSMYSWMSDERRYNFLNLIIPTDYGAFSVNFINFSIGGIEARESDTESYTAFDYSDNAYFAGWGKELVRALSGQSFSMGANVKLVQSGMGKYTGTGFSFDAGVIVKPFAELSAGIMFRDMAGGLRWSTGYEEKYPFVMALALQGALLDKALNISAEAEKNEFEGMNIKCGAEAVFFRIFSARGGVSYSAQSYEFNFSLGAGVKYPFAGIIAQADYAFTREQVYTSFEPQHKLSLAVFF